MSRYAHAEVGTKSRVTPSGAAGQVSCLDRTGQCFFPVENEHLRIVRDHDLPRAPLAELPCGGFPVAQTGQNLRLGGIGLEEVHIRQEFAFVGPVMKAHRTALIVPQKALCVCGQPRPGVQRLQQFAGKVSVQQPRQMTHVKGHIRQLIHRDRVGLRGAAGISALAVRGEILIAHQCGFCRGQQRLAFCREIKVIHDLCILRRNLDRREHCRACRNRGGGAEGDCAAYTAVLSPGKVDVYIPRGRAENHQIKLSHFAILSSR